MAEEFFQAACKLVNQLKEIPPLFIHDYMDDSKAQRVAKMYFIDSICFKIFQPFKTRQISNVPGPKNIGRLDVPENVPDLSQPDGFYFYCKKKETKSYFLRKNIEIFLRKS